jgi:hypothetical protein
VRIRHRLAREPFPWVKVVVPAHVARLRNACVSQGSHAIELDGRPLDMEPVGDGYLAHFPFRSPEQRAARIAIATLQKLAMPDHDPNWGRHNREGYDLLREDPRAFTAAFYDLARRFAVMPDVPFEPETVPTASPYLGGPLRHTPAGDEASRAFTVLLAYAEQLARAYADLLRRVDEEAPRVEPEREPAVAPAIRFARA